MTLRVAIAGGGFIGVDHAVAYAAQPDAEIVAFVGRDAERTAAVADRFGARPYADLAELLRRERPDALSVCTPTALHRPFVEAAAGAGVHVLLEKPMATNVADCDAIEAACRRAGITLMLAFTHRFHAELLVAKRLIDEGRLGTPMLAQDVFTFGEHSPWPAWYYDRELSGGGELIHDAVHLVDRLAWLIGSPIIEVYGRTTTYARGIVGVEDGGVAVLTFASGAIAALFVNEATYPIHRDSEQVPMPGRCEIEVHGSRGTIRYRTWHELTVDIAGEGTTIIAGTDRGEMGREIREFIDAILERRPPIVGAAEGRRGIAVVGAIYESERRGRPVAVDELFPEPARRSQAR
ncbi:MAG: Gfo/Idh/MocA family oxidoreductase [Chloroflexi bacterium]|nr:Gfo/Idh/MocA family oxidoreductase [Chloroflexota bacterium]